MAENPLKAEVRGEGGQQRINVVVKQTTAFKRTLLQVTGKQGAGAQAGGGARRWCLVVGCVWVWQAGLVGSPGSALAEDLYICRAT